MINIRATYPNTRSNTEERFFDLKIVIKVYVNTSRVPLDIQTRDFMNPVCSVQIYCNSVFAEFSVAFRKARLRSIYLRECGK
jgi:hypothetical protein